MGRRVYNDGTLVEEWDDTARAYRWLEGGQWLSRPYDQGEVAPLVAADDSATSAANRRALLAKASAAVAADLDYLAVTSPTAPQVAAQAARLTRQVVSLLRIAAGLLDDTSGT